MASRPLSANASLAPRSTDRSIAWHWELPATREAIAATYRYPGENDSESTTSHISFKLQRELLLELEVPQSDDRFAIISEAITRATDIAQNKRRQAKPRR